MVHESRHLESMVISQYPEMLGSMFTLDMVGLWKDSLCPPEAPVATQVPYMK